MSALLPPFVLLWAMAAPGAIGWPREVLILSLLKLCRDAWTTWSWTDYH